MVKRDTFYLNWETCWDRTRHKESSSVHTKKKKFKYFAGWRRSAIDTLTTNMTLWHYIYLCSFHCLLSLINTTTHFFSFFCAAFFFTICNRFMALNWDSWDVCPLSPAAAVAAAFDPLPLLPFPPPLLPPFPPALTWELLGELDPFPWFSPLDGRFSDCFPRVRGGGGFSDAWLEPFPLLPPGAFEEPSPDLVPANPDSPTGFWPEDADKVLWLPPELEEPSLELAGLAGPVLAPKAAQPARPLPEEEELLLLPPPPEGLPDVPDAWNDKGTASYITHWKMCFSITKGLFQWWSLLFLWNECVNACKGSYEARLWAANLHLTHTQHDIWFELIILVTNSADIFFF